jgi:hypothetical protein
LLKSRDGDLERGRVRLDENKTDDPRAWALSPDVVRTLAWWKKRQQAEDDDLVIGLDLRRGHGGCAARRGQRRLAPRTPSAISKRRV